MWESKRETKQEVLIIIRQRDARINSLRNDKAWMNERNIIFADNFMRERKRD